MNTNRQTEITLKELGIKHYKEAWEIQEQHLQEIIQIKLNNRKLNQQKPTPNYLLWVEHPPVITIGKSGNSANLLLQKEEMLTKGIEFYETNRGGDITFHGPGQIVGYPIIDLENYFTDIHKFLRCIEEAIILTLADYSLSATRSKGETGVWLDTNTPWARKICAIGLKASRWVTMHGFALNVNTDLSFFEYIIPCGIKGKAVTSLKKELKREVDTAEVKEKIAFHFRRLLEGEVKDS